MSDIKRFFQYHGAEHKVINTYEAGEELTVDNVKHHSRYHMRCGTNFITIVLILNIFIFTLVTGGARLAFFPRVGAHLLLMPIVAGISYEVLKFLGKENAPKWAKTLARPGLATQAITTREPDDSQIETAIAALMEVLETDQSLDMQAQQKSQLTL
jgi:uncharacterized protein YqhQ